MLTLPSCARYQSALEKAVETVETHLVSEVRCSCHMAEETDLDDTGEHLDFLKQLFGRSLRQTRISKVDE